MARLAPTVDTLRSLFAKSGNICTFPGCANHLIDENNKFVGQICHIEAAESGGERFNPSQLDEERRSHNNLILFCYTHHVETNDVNKYPVKVLKQFKLEHEKRYGIKPFKIDEAHLYKLVTDMETYWSRIENIHIEAQKSHEFPVVVSANSSFFDVFQELNGHIDWVMKTFDHLNKSEDELPKDLKNLFGKLGLDAQLLEKIPYYENPFENRNWEIRKIGFHNITTDLKTSLAQIEIKFLEEYLKTHPEDGIGRSRLEVAKKEFEEIVAKHGYID